MAKIVFPSENAVGTIDSTSTQVLREHALTLYARACQPSPLKCFVFTGFEVYANPGANSVRLEYGSGGHYAIINGSMISFDADINLTGLTDNTHFIYALLTRDGNLATTWELVSNITGVSPTYSVCLASVVVAGGVAGTPANAVHSPLICTGSYVGDSAADRLIFLGFQPKQVEIRADGDTDTILIRPYPGLGIMRFVNALQYEVNGSDTYAHHSIATQGFNVGYATSAGFNYTGTAYYWMAYA